ncbi:MAG: ribonuclease E/G [Alphaproteobacteria bacterium]|nr:ribonuclease E/G [Alphaproteobacteria bacterium]
MTRRMLIDAAHAEETRVVVAENTELLEFDYETTTKSQLKGNIYLAKVTRVEPSLQAAFVDFGGNRHGFLAFNEIHPDYYRIPVEDREALIAESADVEDDSDDVDDIEVDAPTSEDSENPDDNDGESEAVEVIGDNAEDDIAELGDAHRKRLRQLTRMYKIQEVIKRRQILLVQVVKEERGNKGAALTTYLSLPGRYCVLMPNTSRGGGISRKVSNPAHRKRMKTIMADLEIPEGMAVIMRTAGVERNKAEVRRDYEYLRRTWDDIRKQTLQSSAPAMIYEEGDLVKRSLRDVYNREIEEIIVDGEVAYKAARALMRTMMPSHAKRVKKYADTDIPLFNRYSIEAQLDEIYDPIVHLKSGGYIVINPTEALVAIDVNSGRATRERNVEQTARKTNLEAADEVARQLRLRDLAGLVVIDFIDMDENRNNAAVERRMKEAMKADRARIQIGRISPLGLLELSRQRLRPSIHEASAQVCVRCGGSGYVRSTESTALRVLRAVEEEGIRARSRAVTVKVPAEVALYILNQKRDMIVDIEARYNFRVFIAVDVELTPPDYIMERVNTDAAEDETVSETVDSRTAETKAREDEERSRRRRRPRRRDSEKEDAAETVEASEPAEAEAGESETSDEEPRPASRRRGRRGGRRRRKSADSAATNGETTTDGLAAQEEEPQGDSAEAESSDATVVEADGTAAEASGEGEEEAKPKRRRPRRRRTRKPNSDVAVAAETSSENDTAALSGDGDAAVASIASEDQNEAPATEEADASPEPVEAAPVEVAEVEAAEPIPAEPAEESTEETAPEIEPAAEDDVAVNGEEEVAQAAEEPAAEPVVEPTPEPDRPRRSGWWSRATS